MPDTSHVNALLHGWRGLGIAYCVVLLSIDWRRDV